MHPRGAERRSLLHAAPVSSAFAPHHTLVRSAGYTMWARCVPATLLVRTVANDVALARSGRHAVGPYECTHPTARLLEPQTLRQRDGRLGGLLGVSFYRYHDRASCGRWSVVGYAFLIERRKMRWLGPSASPIPRRRAIFLSDFFSLVCSVLSSVLFLNSDRSRHPPHVYFLN